MMRIAGYRPLEETAEEMAIPGPSNRPDPPIPFPRTKFLYQEVQPIAPPRPTPRLRVTNSLPTQDWLDDFRQQARASAVHDAPMSREFELVDSGRLKRWEESVPLPPMQIAEKHRVYFKGKKRSALCNRKPIEEVEELPMFVKEPMIPKPTRRIRTTGPCARAALLAKMESDVDLVYALKFEAAFIPRSANLLLQLKQKARKWLKGWDLSNYTSKEIYDMAMNAVGQAMLVDPKEEQVRALMHMYEERDAVRPGINAFLVEGRTGSGPRDRLDHQSAKVSAVKEFLLRPLARATRF